MIASPKPESGIALPPTPLLQRDLRDIDRVIAMLLLSPSSDQGDRDDLRWLKEQRRFLVKAIAARRRQRHCRVIDLEAWRSGGFASAAVAAKAA